MSSYSSINTRAYLQYILLLTVIFGIGYYLRGQNMKTGNTADSDTAMPTQLTITDTPADTYPEKRFGSDKKWHEYLSSEEASGLTHYNGEGNIASYDVDVDFVINPDGTIIGRYHNANSTKLDLNGYVESQTGDLYIHLGHKSERSSWHLSPIESESTTSKFVYEGTWGKKKHPSKITIVANPN